MATRTKKQRRRRPGGTFFALYIYTNSLGKSERRHTTPSGKYEPAKICQALAGLALPLVARLSLASPYAGRPPEYCAPPIGSSFALFSIGTHTHALLSFARSAPAAAKLFGSAGTLT
ncbi:unnamed protein product, partial [Clonostachys byssicola]